MSVSNILKRFPLPGTFLFLIASTQEDKYYLKYLKKTP